MAIPPDIAFVMFAGKVGDMKRRRRNPLSPSPGLDADDSLAQPRQKSNKLQSEELPALEPVFENEEVDEDDEADESEEEEESEADEDFDKSESVAQSLGKMIDETLAREKKASAPVAVTTAPGIEKAASSAQPPGNTLCCGNCGKSYAEVDLTQLCS